MKFPAQWHVRPLALLLATLACCGAARAIQPGATAPDLQLPGLKEAVSLAQLKGKVVYVDFWASWCGPCKQSFPFMNQLQSKYGSQGLEIIAVNLDARRGDVDSFLTEVPAQFTIALDAKGESARRFEVKGMPSSVLIGRDGKVFALHTGFRGEDRTRIEQGIVDALAVK